MDRGGGKGGVPEKEREKRERAGEGGERQAERGSWSNDISGARLYSWWMVMELNMMARVA